MMGALPLSAMVVVVLVVVVVVLVVKTELARFVVMYPNGPI
jgi:hypothetical protein